MPKAKKKPDLTLVEGGMDTLEDYKQMINTMMLRLVGREAKYTEEEWQKNFEEFKEAAAKGKPKEK